MGAFSASSSRTIFQGGFHRDLGVRCLEGQTQAAVYQSCPVEWVGRERFHNKSGPQLMKGMPCEQTRSFHEAVAVHGLEHYGEESLNG